MSKSRNSGKAIPLRRGGKRKSVMPLELPESEHAFRLLWEGLERVEREVPPRRIPRTVFFGSARVDPDDPVYAEYRDMSCEITANGFDVVTGGGPGLMTAVNEGAMMGIKKNPRAWSHGVCIKQVNREEPPNNFLKRAYFHGLLLTRMHQFIRLGWFGAFIIGEDAGFGTDVERGLIHQLIQLDHMRREVPLIGVGEMWMEHAAWAKKWIIDRGFADPNDGKIMTCVPKAMDAVPIVLEACRRTRAARATG